MATTERSLQEYVGQITSTETACNLAVNEVLVRRFVNHCQDSRGRTPATLGAYESLLGMYVAWLRGTHLWAVELEQMEEFVNRPRMRRGAGTNGAAASRKRDANMLRTFYKWAWETNQTDDWLAKALHGPTVPRRNPRPIPDPQFLRVWQADLGAVDRVLVGFGFYLGLRVTEVAALRPSQVTDTRITDFIRKGGGEDTLDWSSIMDVYRLRLAHLGDANGALLGAVQQLRSDRQSERFLLPYGGQGSRVSKRFRALTGKLGLGQLTAHQMRHSAATNLIRAGLPIPLVKDVMNHTDINITMGYVKAGSAELREFLDLHHPDS